ncbi:MAG: MFS transporter [Patescibacteria group bacterium]|jgi:MFS family permease
MAKKIIRNYTAFMLFDGLAISFFFATFQLFLDHKGLNLLEINLLNFVFMSTIFLFEVPTGVIADFFGRKRSVVIGLWFHALGFLIYFFSDFFWQFLIAEIICAFALTCVSGALEALVVDSLNHYNYDGKLEKVFRRGEIRQLGVILGAIIGSFVGQFNLAWPWLLSSGAFILLALATSVFFREDYFIPPLKKEINGRSLGKIVQESFSLGLKNKKLIFIILFSSLLALITQPLNMYWPLVLKDNFFLPTKYMGLAFSGMAIFIYGGSQLSHFWQKRFKSEENSIIFSQIITFVGILGCLWFSNLYPFLFFLFFHEIGRGLFSPLNRAYINKNISGKNRATILSLESMIVKVGAGIGLISSGLIANNFGILNSWLVSAMILFFGILFFWLRKKR